MTFSRFAEGTPRHKGNVFGCQNFLGKGVVVKPCFFYTGENVKCALRLKTVKSHFVKAVVNQAAAAVVFGHHFVLVLFAAPQRFHGGHLRRNGGAKHGVLVNFGHGRADCFVGDCVADAPTRHGVGFGKTVKQNRPFFHLGKSGKTNRLALISQIAVYFVRYNDKVMLFGNFDYYWIVDRQGRVFKRLNELFATTGQVGFMTTQRVDGKMVLPEAVKVMQVKGSSASSGT